MLSAIVNKGLRANFGLFAEMGATPLDLEAMLGSKQTFDEAMASVKLFSRNRLKQMKEQVFSAIADTQLPCFLPSEEETAQ
ncbi:hypothetical protein QTO03_18900 [Vibrio campbellii]|uniref:hypothetical protein n=1 Tax=Vibrio campbellii TaxID=680 RepID=UPI002F3FA0E5